jgi:hypothetical protein
MESDLKGFSLRDALLIIGMQKRTGELVLESGNNIGTIVFHRGNILQALSPYSLAIGDRLVEEDVITEMELIETLMLQKKGPYAPLGSLLIKDGKTTFEVVERLVHDQVRQAMTEFQAWNGLTLSVSQKDLQPYDAIHLSVREFIPGDVLKTALCFLSENPCASEVLPPAAPLSAD